MTEPEARAAAWRPRQGLSQQLRVGMYYALTEPQAAYGNEARSASGSRPADRRLPYAGPDGADEMMQGFAVAVQMEQTSAISTIRSRFTRPAPKSSSQCDRGHDVLSTRASLPESRRPGYVDASALVIGRVEYGDDVSSGRSSVARGDVNVIKEIGARTNVQDEPILHGRARGPIRPGAGMSTDIGDDVTVGQSRRWYTPRASADRCLIGIGEECCWTGRWSRMR